MRATRRLFSAAFVETSLALPKDFGVRVIPSFVTEEEEASLEACCAPSLQKKPWERDHFDAVIKNYRESQILASKLPPPAAAAVARALAHFPAAAGAPLDTVHALELSPTGCIDAHVDSVKFSGGVVAGLCLRSEALMHLLPDEGAAEEGRAPTALAAKKNSSPLVKVLLPRRCLYLLTGEARYGWGHAIPLQGTFYGRTVARGPQGRLSVMLRDALVAR